MRTQGIWMLVVAAGLCSLIAVLANSDSRQECQAPSAKSVESLLAPCLELRYASRE
jgi:hypothetical protein